MELELMFATPDDLQSTLCELSKTGGAWIAIRHGFSNRFRVLSYRNPSSVPGEMLDLTRYDYTVSHDGLMAWKGEIRGFTPSAISREAQRGLRRD